MSDDEYLEVKKDGIKILTSKMGALPAAEKDKDQYEVLTKEQKIAEGLNPKSIYKRNKSNKEIELVEYGSTIKSKVKNIENIVDGDYIKQKTTYFDDTWEITKLTPFVAKTEYKTYDKAEKIAIGANPDAIIQEATAGPDIGGGCGEHALG